MFTAPATLKIDDGTSVGDNVAKSDGEADVGTNEYDGGRKETVDVTDGVLSVKF